jgi:hypothetical protein
MGLRKHLLFSPIFYLNYLYHFLKGMEEKTSSDRLMKAGRFVFKIRKLLGNALFVKWIES